MCLQPVTKLKIYAPWAIILVFVLILLGAWYKSEDLAKLFITPPAPIVQVEYREGPERIVYLNRPELAKRDLLPESVKRDTDKEVTAVATVPEHKGDTTVIAVIDTGTGETTLETRQERPSLFELSNAKVLGIRYDINRKGTLYGSWEFLRVGAFHMELYGEINSENRAYAGVGIEYRW